MHVLLCTRLYKLLVDLPIQVGIMMYVGWCLCFSPAQGCPTSCTRVYACRPVSANASQAPSLGHHGATLKISLWLSTYTYTYMHIRTHIHTHTHTHIYIYRRLVCLLQHSWSRFCNLLHRFDYCQVLCNAGWTTGWREVPYYLQVTPQYTWLLCSVSNQSLCLMLRSLKQHPLQWLHHSPMPLSVKDLRVYLFSFESHLCRSFMTGLTSLVQG